MAARFDDAKAGWQIWRQSGFTLARDELNARLEALGHMPVSVRTFAHYEKLRRYGYERYVPINQLDVKSLKDRGRGCADGIRCTPIPWER